MSEKKRGRGRPKKDGLEVRNCTMNVNVTALLKWKISDLAEKAEITVSDFLLIAVDRYIKEIENAA